MRGGARYGTGAPVGTTDINNHQKHTRDFLMILIPYVIHISMAGGSCGDCAAMRVGFIGSAWLLVPLLFHGNEILVGSNKVPAARPVGDASIQQCFAVQCSTVGVQ